MNVYDFDKTIYRNNSMTDFALFCLKKHPSLVLCLPKQAWAVVQYKMGRLSLEEAKTAFYSFVQRLPDVEETVRAFWQESRKKIYPWYLAQKRADDIVISASPVFVLQPICDELGVALIATDIDRQTGILNGTNCKGAEKPRRFRAQYPNATVKAFYSDSLSDTPMAKLAEQAFLVRGESRLPWPGL